MTGWGQDGPLAPRAGHDLNYIALSGALHSIGVKGGKPVPPLNLVGDFGGGGLLLAFGMVCALLERERSGRGQVVDAAMLDGAISMMAMFCGFRAMGLFEDATGSSLLGGAAHFYDTYETADGRFLAVAPIEPEFYTEFLDRVGVDRERFLPHGFRMGRMDSAQWDPLKRELAAAFRNAHARRMVRAVRRQRRLRDPGARPVRGAASSAQCGAAKLRRSGRSDAECARTTFQPQRDRPAVAATAPRRGHARGAGQRQVMTRPRWRPWQRRA